jgi:hypothetical protein
MNWWGRSSSFGCVVVVGFIIVVLILLGGVSSVWKKEKMLTIINMIAFVVAVVALFLFLHYLCAAKGAPFCSVSRCFPPPPALSLSLSLS